MPTKEIYPPHADLYASGNTEAILQHQKPPHRKNVRRFIKTYAEENELRFPVVDVASGYRNNFPEAVGDPAKRSGYIAFDHTATFDRSIEGFPPNLLADAQDIPLLDNVAGTVICTEALEHIENDVKAVKEMARVLQHGGTLILTVPGSDVPIHEKLPHQIDYRKVRGEYCNDSLYTLLDEQGVTLTTIEHCYLDEKHINILAVGKKR